MRYIFNYLCANMAPVFCPNVPDRKEITQHINQRRENIILDNTSKLAKL